MRERLMMIAGISTGATAGWILGVAFHHPIPGFWLGGFFGIVLGAVLAVKLPGQDDLQPPRGLTD